MQEKELEDAFEADREEEKDVFEEAQPVFDEEETILQDPEEEDEYDEDEERDSSEEECDEEDEEDEEDEDDDYDEDDEDDGDDDTIDYKDESLVKRTSGTKKKKPSILGEFFSFLLYIAAAVFITFLIIHFVGQRTVVNGPSMMNTLQDKDNIILDKISYRFHEPERFDVIVFPVKNEEKNYIKRIIGLPGETVQIINGFVYITDKDGKFYELEESYGAEIMLDDTTGEYLTTSPVTLGEDEYFVLGDNRNNSIDSRRIGPVSRDIIKGRAWVRIYPFDQMGKIE